MSISAYIDHVAFRVNDLQWHIDFFDQVLGMKVLKTSTPGSPLKQVWLHGGIQLICTPGFTGNASGQLGHLGIKVHDLDATLLLAQSKGVTELPQGKNWFSLPEGICIELLQMG